MRRVYEAWEDAATTTATSSWTERLSRDECATAQATVDPAAAACPPEDPSRPGQLAPAAHTRLVGAQRPRCTFDELIRAIARDEQQFDL